MKKLTVWQKAGIVNAIVATISIPLVIYLSTGGPVPNCINDHIPLLVPAILTLLIPALWLTVFDLWHWRTRYNGRYRLGWAVVFAVGALPIQNYLPLGLIFILIYFYICALPEVLGKDKGISWPENLVEEEILKTRKYQIQKSTCFITGWVIIILGTVLVITDAVTTYIIMNRLETDSKGWVGQNITESWIGAFWTMSQVCKITVVTAVFAVILATAGAILLYISQNMRWRLLEQKEKEDLSKGI